MSKSRSRANGEEVELRQVIEDLEAQRASSKQLNEKLLAEIKDYHKRAEELEFIDRVLKISNQETEKSFFLEELVTAIQEFSACEGVGIRILDEKGGIPYEAYKGFSKEFYESESPLSIENDKCMCINVIRGDIDSKLSFYSEFGSFFMNGTTKFLATISGEQKRQMANKCNKEGYESVALIPIRKQERILGLIHIADKQEKKVPIELVRVLEKAGMLIGPVIQRTRAEEAIKTSLKEKELLLKEVHHRTKNNFQVISSMLYLQSEYFDDEKVFGVFEKCQSRIKSMAAVHEQLYKSEDLTNIDFAEYAHDLLVSLYHSCGISERSIGFKINIEQVFLGLDLAIPCGLIINELFSNSLKHGFGELHEDGHSDAQICIDMHKTDDNEFKLVVSDNGSGFIGGLDSMDGKSLGLFLVKNLTEQLEGTIELDTDRGTKFTIKFPCNER